MTLETSKQIRNHHSSYQRVYFAEEIKQRLSFFLSDKLFGKNLDIGGGRYSYYPNSTVVDLSPVALEYNPAKEKVEFDMESIHDGAKLPFPDHSFDHATMVSVFQYIQHREEVANELMRVLKPGAELYILDCGGYVSECLASHNTSMEEFFKQKGFTAFVEYVPFRSDVREFQSLCVAMPDTDLFGPNKGVIRNRKERELKNAALLKYKPFSLNIRTYDEEENDDTTSEDIFTKEYLHRELRRMNKFFLQLVTYPVTAYSMEYKKNIEAFTQECLAKTDAIPIITSNIYNDIGIDMITEDNKVYTSFHILGKDGKPSNESEHKVMEIANTSGMNMSRHMGHFHGNTPEEIVKFYENRHNENTYDSIFQEGRKATLSETERCRLISFLAEIPLNSTTKALQEKLYPVAKSRYPDIDNRILTEKARGYSSLLRTNKQRRRGEKLLQTKTLCSQGKIDVIERKKIDYLPIIQQFPAMLEKEDAEAFKGHGMMSLDD